MYQLVLTLILCWLALPVLAQQQLAKARQKSYLTRIFRLTTAQAQRLYERGLLAARPDFFTVPVDSFLTDSAAPRRLPLGYYLVAHTEGPELVYWLRAETSRTVEVVDNQSDLSLTVRDSLGRLRPDARVAVAGRPLPYDPATRTYRRAHGGRPGLVAVTADGRTTFHPLAQPAASARGGWALRAGRRVLYGRPLGYLTVPVWHLAHDLKHASRASTGLVGLLRSAFSEDLRDERQSQRADHRRERWLSYLVVGQPRYRPTGDTLRLKARVLRRGSGRAATQPLTLWLGGGGLGHRKCLATLRPVRSGSYEYSLPLTDTLGLRVGTRADLYLEDSHENTAAEGSFQFEEYELKNNHYALRLLAKEPWRGQPQAVFMRGSDANELNLPDARVRLAVLPATAPGPLPTRRLFVPDTLWTHAQALDPLGETRVNLPPGIFPDVDLSYSVQATFLTSDNEVLLPKGYCWRIGFGIKRLFSEASYPLLLMSLHPQPSTPVPPQTRQVAQAAFPRGNRYLQLRDTLGTLYDDALFADLFPARGQAAQSPWQLALVTLLQFAENLSDRQAADAVRSRIDWK